MAGKRKCRVCDHDLYRKPLLGYAHMPKAAQYLPDKQTLKNDKGVRLVVRQCSGCGLVQLTNKPVSYYKEVIRAAACSPEMQSFRARQFSDFVKRYSLKGKKVVEIGCGHGEYLGIMRGQGVHAFGVEYGAEAVAQCVKNGLKVKKGFIGKASAEIPGGPFDAFFIMNFLEHLPDPRKTLAGIRHNLSEGAVGLVEVPNFDLILKENLFSEFIPDHLFYFTKKTLSLVLEQNGFEVLACNVVWHGYIISAVIRKMKRTDVSRFRLAQESLQRQLCRYIARFGSRRVAIWGAGHQAFAVIALTHIAGKIKYVVDSAPFKQGRYTPATHIPILSPEALVTDPVDAVIVIAASYSDEVARIIQRDHGKHLHVAILKGLTLKRVSP